MGRIRRFGVIAAVLLAGLVAAGVVSAHGHDTPAPVVWRDSVAGTGGTTGGAP